ncbi:hypothetical protein [Meiothermus phage MMP17]|nr:hypothetical protein [Meiothermus phage MMP7]QAY18032.1 hypothetical protein [Meiothermus phage MMP17]
MTTNRIAQDRARLEWMLQRARERLAQLREKRSRLPVDSLEWVRADEAVFEARCELQQIKTAIRMAGRVWECVECGKRYDYEWVYEYGRRCDVECDHELVEVRNG